MMNCEKKSETATKFTIGRCILVKDESTSEIRFDNGKSISLTYPESSILRCLYEHRGKVVNKHDLIVAGWGRPDTIGSNSLPVAITNIRKVLKLAEIEIVNVPKVGYKLDIPKLSNGLKEDSNEIEEQRETTTQVRRNISLSRICLLSSICILGSLFMVSLFTFMAWVRVDCHIIKNATVCYNVKDTRIPAASSLPLKSGDVFYLNGEHWFQVSRKEGLLND
ncbi:transcriptional regulator [Vibrio profundi]|uniref:winged helix-turn-helix domain-containing protein n=1 Tax=Vibrio profundi TaxID=1774960 RepID=UPI003736DDE5